MTPRALARTNAKNISTRSAPQPALTRGWSTLFRTISEATMVFLVRTPLFSKESTIALPSPPEAPGFTHNSLEPPVGLGLCKLDWRTKVARSTTTKGRFAGSSVGK